MQPECISDSGGIQAPKAGGGLRQNLRIVLYHTASKYSPIVVDSHWKVVELHMHSVVVVDQLLELLHLALPSQAVPTNTEDTTWSWSLSVDLNETDAAKMSRNCLLIKGGGSNATAVQPQTVKTVETPHTTVLEAVLDELPHRFI